MRALFPALPADDALPEAPGGDGAPPRAAARGVSVCWCRAHYGLLRRSVGWSGGGLTVNNNADVAAHEHTHTHTQHTAFKARLCVAWWRRREKAAARANGTPYTPSEAPAAKEAEKPAAPSAPRKPPCVQAGQAGGQLCMCSVPTQRRHSLRGAVVVRACVFLCQTLQHLVCAPHAHRHTHTHAMAHARCRCPCVPAGLSYESATTQNRPATPAPQPAMEVRACVRAPLVLPAHTRQPGHTARSHKEVEVLARADVAAAARCCYGVMRRAPSPPRLGALTSASQRSQQQRRPSRRRPSRRHPAKRQSPQTTPWATCLAQTCGARPSRCAAR
jgi:hypothetical protein